MESRSFCATSFFFASRAPTVVDGPLGGGDLLLFAFFDAGEVVLLSQHIVGEIHKMHEARGVVGPQRTGAALMAKMPAACSKAEPGPKPGSWGFEFFLSKTSTVGTCSPSKAPVVGSYSTSSLTPSPPSLSSSSALTGNENRTHSFMMSFNSLEMVAG